MIYEIIIGPDEQEGGVAYYMNLKDNFSNYHSQEGSGGWDYLGPRKSTTERWFSYAKRHLHLPKKIKQTKLKWSDADVKPYGYSQGAGHTPQGIRI